MKYFSTFSGIGGFELGIIKAYEQYLDDRRTTSTSTLEERRSESMPNASDGDGWRSNPTCVGYSEIDKYASAIYQSHFPYEQCEKCRLENERQSEGTPPRDTERRGGEQSDSGSERLTCNCKHKNYGDITKINAEELPDFDLLVGGVPCQSWSIAGKRGGFEDERGNMWFQYARLLRAKQPKYFVAENVKGLLSHDGGESMERICEELCTCGYAIDFEVLNSKNHGVPQNRERVIIIGVRLDLLDACQVF